MSQTRTKRKNPLPDIDAYVGRLVRQCDTHATYADNILRACYRVVPFMDDLPIERRERLAKALDDLLDRTRVGVEPIVRGLRGERPPRRVHALKGGA